jgi:hypothetical protein
MDCSPLSQKIAIVTFLRLQIRRETKVARKLRAAAKHAETVALNLLAKEFTFAWMQRFLWRRRFPRGVKKKKRRRHSAIERALKSLSLLPCARQCCKGFNGAGSGTAGALPAET